MPDSVILGFGVQVKLQYIVGFRKVIPRLNVSLDRQKKAEIETCPGSQSEWFIQYIVLLCFKLTMVF